MKKWIITGLVVATLAALAVTQGRWLPPLLVFIGARTDLIQGLSDLIQLLLWAGAFVALIARLWRPKKNHNQSSPPEPASVITAKGGGVAADKIKGSSVITGDNNSSLSHSNVSGSVAGRDVIIYNSDAPAAALALHQLPPPPKDFTGRKAELDQLLAEHNRGRSIFLLHGMGGIGKTALALDFADQLKASYPDAQFHMDLRGASRTPLSTVEIQSYIIRAYHPTIRLPESEHEVTALFRSVLDGKRVLLFLDNAEGSSQLNPVVPPDVCVLVITSRTLFHLPDLFPLKVETMTEQDARDLLLRIAPKIAEQADVIARLCGYLPLALRLAASALRERVDLSVNKYVQLLTDKQSRLKLIDASINLSYDLLDEQRQKIWPELAVFADTFDVMAAAAVWTMNEDEAQEQLSEFVKGSLIEWNEATGRYGLHDLVHLFADEQLQQEERSRLQKLHARHYLQVLWAANDLYLEGGESLKQGLRLLDLEWGNIQVGQSWAATHNIDDEAAAMCSQYPNAGTYLLELRQHPRERIAWRESALEAARKIGDRGSEGAHLGNLGIAYAALGEPLKAIELYKQRLIIAREIGDRRGEGAVLGNLGLAYADLGETRKAIEFYEQHLIIAREIGERRGEGAVLGNLGLAYADLGEPLKAIEFYEQRLIIAREIGDMRGEGNALGNLGLAYADLGEPRKAVDFYEQQLTIVREIGDRRGEGNALGNKAVALHTLGDKQQATACMQAALTIFEAIESPGAASARKLLDQWGQAK